MTFDVHVSHQGTPLREKIKGHYVSCRPRGIHSDGYLAIHRDGHICVCEVPQKCVTQHTHTPDQQLM